jgi:hypothetical protein
MVIRPEVHGVVREARRDVDVAAPDANAGTVHRAVGVVAEAHAAGVVGVGVVVALAPLALGVAQGVAADNDHLVVGIGDAVHAVLVELHVAAAPGVHLVGGVVALPRHGEHHACLRRRDGQLVEWHVARGVGKQRRACLTADLEALAGAAWTDAERVFDGQAAAAVREPDISVRLMSLTLLLLLIEGFASVSLSLNFLSRLGLSLRLYSESGCLHRYVYRVGRCHS